MNRILPALLLAAPLAAGAAGLACSYRPSTNVPDLKSVARVLPDKAHRIALDAVGGSAKADRGALVTLDSCLVYRFEIDLLDGQKREVIVDAGNGDVLSVGGAPAPVIIEPVVVERVLVPVPEPAPQPLR